MRIIREGSVPLKETILTCGLCKTIFAITKNDVLMVKLWFERKKIYYVQCPMCNQEIITNEESYNKLMERSIW